MSEPLYMIVRFHFDTNVPTEVVERGLSLDDAQAHCKRDDTHGPGWFDGYTLMDEDDIAEYEDEYAARNRSYEQ